MDQEPKLSPQGLYLAPSTLEAPAGGLDKAEEVVIRKVGQAEVRPGFLPVDRFTNNTPSRLLDFSDHYLGVDINTRTTWETGGSVTTEGPGFAHLDWDEDGIEATESRKNLYITTQDGLRKIEHDSATVAKRTGAPTPALVAELGSAGSAIDTDMNVGYRCLTMRRDYNELEVRSAPSNRFILNNAGAAARAIVTVGLHANDDFAVGDVIEIYRSENYPVGILPLDENRLCAIKVLTTADIAAGFITVTDNTDDLALGVALYTNADIEGPEAAHVRPPKAKTVCLFNNSLFLGNLQYPPELILQFNLSRAALVGTADGIGARALVASNMTNGSTTVTVADTTGFKAGMVCFSDSAADWAAGSEYPRIVSVDNGTTLTLSRQWNSTTAAHFITYVDTIRVGSLYHPIGLGGRLFLMSVHGVASEYPIALGIPAQAADTVITATLLNTEISDTNDSVTVLALTGLTPITTAPQVYATHGAEYNPALTEPGGAGLTMPQDILPSCVAWSDPLQPEHFKLENIDFLGHQETPVMTLKPVKNAILAPKSDGLYLISGAGESSGFRFEEHNPNVRLLFQAAAVVVGYKCYLWAESGIFECDGSGVVDISPPIITALSASARAVKLSTEHAVGAWAVANLKEHEVLFSIPAVGDLTKGERLWVFNQTTSTWTNWFMGGDLVAGMYHAKDGTLKIQTVDSSSDGLTHEERDEDARADASYSVTISAFTETDVTIAGGSGWTPAVGDKLTRAATEMRVTAIASATNFTTDVAPPSTGTATAEVAIPAVIRFLGHAGKNPGVLKVFGEGGVWFGDTRGLITYALTTTSALSQTGITQTKNLGAVVEADDPLPETYRYRVPRNHSRSTRLYVELNVRAAGSPWALDCISVGYRVSSPRVRNR